ncbi:hypothetical protein EON65_11195 [archaeon]|nr:MAG: hypothetical protein EON65_11195 [archaeon]
MRAVNFNSIALSAKNAEARSATVVATKPVDVSNVSTSKNVSDLLAMATQPLPLPSADAVRSAEDSVAPMQVVASMNDYGLGCTTWW